MLYLGDAEDYWIGAEQLTSNAAVYTWIDGTAVDTALIQPTNYEKQRQAKFTLQYRFHNSPGSPPWLVISQDEQFSYRYICEETA